MPLHTPVRYLRQRSARKHSSKPTAAAKITSRPYIQPQLSSPLFQLPAEIRTEIFSYALLAYADPAKPFSRHTYHYRPSYTHARRIATALLLVCRRVYLETSLLPLILNTHIVYGGETSHAPPSYRAYLFPTNLLRTVQRDAIRKVHLFARQYWLEDWNERDQWHCFCRSWERRRSRSCEKNDGDRMGGETEIANATVGGLEELRITIRHTDWWYYLLGSGSPLALDPSKAGRARARASRSSHSNGERSASKTPGANLEEGSWGTRFAYFHNLKTLELELETLEAKREELDAVVAAASSWQFPLGDGNILVLDLNATKTEKWTGSANFKSTKSPSPTYVPGLENDNAGALVNPGAGQQQQQQQVRRPTFVASFRGGGSGRRADSVGSEELGEVLDYYIVILTWRARRPEDVIPAEADEEGVEKSRESAAGSDGGVGMQNHPHPMPTPAIPALANGPARAVGRDVIPSYWG